MILTDAVILSLIGSVLLVLVVIIGWFIKRWMNTTDKREEHHIHLIEGTNDALVSLNSTMNKINTNLEVYQTRINESMENVKEKLEGHNKKVEKHDVDLQDHEVRITIIEKTNGNK